MKPKTKVTIFFTSILLFIYGLLFFLNYSHIINNGLFNFIILFFGLFSISAPSILNNYLSKHKVICVRCGAENRYTDNFCSKCGMKLEK